MTEKQKEVSCLTLVRHGESIWNQQNRFTGWVDISLSKAGMEEAARLGVILRDQKFDVAFTSALLRAQDTLYEILKHNHHCDQYMRVHELSSKRYEHFVSSRQDLNELKVYVSEKLNERYYGDLQGQNKDEAKEKYGSDQVQAWRRSYAVIPPGGESLKMTADRVILYYQNCIVPMLWKEKSVLISAHGNSLRALIMHLEGITPTQIKKFEIPTAQPYVYCFNNKIEVLRKKVFSR